MQQQFPHSDHLSQSHVSSTTPPPTPISQLATSLRPPINLNPPLPLASIPHQVFLIHYNIFVNLCNVIYSFLPSYIYIYIYAVIWRLEYIALRIFIYIHNNTKYVGARTFTACVCVCVRQDSSSSVYQPLLLSVYILIVQSISTF